MSVVKIQWEDLPKGTKSSFTTMCRKMVRDGWPEDTVLEAFRGETLSLYGNIHQCAKITLQETPLLGPRFVKYEDKSHLTRYATK